MPSPTMNKQRTYDLIKKLATPALVLSTATIFFLQPWHNKIALTDHYSPYREVHDPIPQQQGTIIQQPDETHSQNSYHITTHLPIYIRRHYPADPTKNQAAHTEYLVLRPLNTTIRDTIDMYELIENVNIENSKEKDTQKHHMRYEPQVIDSYTTPQKTNELLRRQKDAMKYQKGYLTLGIFHRIDNQERLVGRLTVDSIHAPTIPQGAYCSYFTGHPNDIQVKGITRLCLEATINHLIETGHIPKKIKGKAKNKMVDNKIVLIIDKRNKKSKNIAEKLHFTRYEAADRHPGGRPVVPPYW